MTKEVSGDATSSKTFVPLEATLLADSNMTELLALLAERCVGLLDVDAVGLMLVAPNGGLRVAASSDDHMRAVGLFELQAQEGPCIDAWRDGAAVLDQPLEHNRDRWPAFAPEAEAHGFATVHALPIRLHGEVIGALNLFSRHTRPLPTREVQVAEAMAEIATFVVLQHRTVLHAQMLNGQLKQALSTRIRIEQAKGIVAARLGVDMEQSFGHLRGYARHHNRRLAEVAGDVIAGTLTPAQLLQPDGRDAR